ncbi:DgyrCDS3573 [Dimorphilus gyrociliatus]|uniref:Dolichyl-diphosphooligosaccharide--protein glycosyltransferase subunit 1 n=1 Tax=Dimorphilus gyrociliatus TaxID=2664684 RepID=A0A7I8VFN6_9ANNE|nr:DgyrCDS3573 [Dimorphilus gyrociliatus]
MMDKQCKLLFSLLALSLVLVSAAQESISKEITITNVERTINLKTHIPKVISLLTLETTSASGVQSFHYAIEGYYRKHVQYVGAVFKKKDEDDERLVATPVKVTGQSGKLFYRIDLKKKLIPGKNAVVEVEIFLVDSLKPYPSEISQTEKQLVKFEGNVYQYSPYKISKQTTTVKCASSNIVSHSKSPKPVEQKEAVVTYGPYEEREPFTEAALDLHFENHSPFLTVSNLERLIEVSHWGNIAIEESIDIRHAGAVLKGSFSRYDYQHSRDQGASIKSFKTLLPAAARDVYYRDEIGNISTSNLKDLDDAMELELRPRFPLFGGWKTHYVLGYNVPSYQYLYHSGDRFVLKLRFVDHIFDDQIVEQARVKVVLPEGASDIKLKTPYPVKREGDERIYTYLDTVGRPVVVLSKENLVENHIQDFEVYYTYRRFFMLQEPLLVVGFLYLLFLSVIIYMRLDFSITKDEAEESRLRVSSLIEQLQAAHDRRSALVQSYEDAINKFKSSKDSNAFTSARKKNDADYKQLTGQIDSIAQKLKAEQSEEADKVADLQKLDKELREQVLASVTHAEKLVAGKLQKQHYLELEQAAANKRNDLSAKMDNLVASM